MGGQAIVTGREHDEIGKRHAKERDKVVDIWISDASDYRLPVKARTFVECAQDQNPR